MSACEKFREFLVSEMERLSKDDQDRIRQQTGDILWQFDAIHQHSQENTGAKCACKEVSS